MTGDLNDSNNLSFLDLWKGQQEYRSMVRVIKLSPFGFAKFCQYINLVQGCDYCLPLVGEQFISFILGDMLHIFPNDPSRNMRVSHLKRRRRPPVKSRSCSRSSGWWFGTWLLFFHLLGSSSSQLTNSIIFQRGWLKPPTSH